MGWKLDNIDFENYGVYVRKSSGVLDLPKLQTKPHNWLDENGDDYWQGDGTEKYDERTITLSCWILAEGYSAFKTKVETFWNALLDAGTRTLQTPFGNNIEVYLDTEIKLDRKAPYVSSQQLGLFTLKFIVAGDGKDLLSICRHDGDDVVEVVETDDLKVYKTLQGDMYASCSFEANHILDIQCYDFIIVDYNGNGYDRFMLFTEPVFTKKSTNLYEYKLQFYHHSSWLSRAQFMFQGESDFDGYFANLSEILDLMIENTSARLYNLFQKGTVPETVRRNHKFSGDEDCLGVLKRICAEYELEFEFKYIRPGYYYEINIAEQIANDTGLSFTYGKGNGKYELSRGARLEDEFFTVLHAFGAAKNLKPGYRSGMRRLSFDGNPLQNLANGWVKEKTIFYEDIYPRRQGTISSYHQVLPADLTDKEKQSHPYGIYRVQDATLDFNINDYLLGGLTAKIRMNSGDCAGYEFEIERYDNELNYIFIIPLKDDRGEQVPNGSLSLSSGDAYVLVDIDQPADYVAAAEAELQTAAQADLDKGSVPKYPYNTKVFPGYVIDNNIYLEVGDRINVIDSDVGLAGACRISSLVYHVFESRYELVLSEKAILSRFQKNEISLKSVVRAMKGTKKDTVESMRKEQETTEEIRTRLLDTQDDCFAADRVARSESFDPRMMAYDAGVPQFFLKDALIEENVDGDEDKVKINAGEISITNYTPLTLSRYEIQKIKDAGGVYDPTRTWTIEATTFQLPTKDGYWMYAKLNMLEDSTECIIEVHDEHKEVKLDIENGYLMYKIANISAGQEAELEEPQPV